MNFFSVIFFNIKDPLSGMKCYNTKIFKNNRFILKSKHDYCGMFFFKICDKKKIFSVDINVKKQNGKSSYGSGLNANVKIIKSFVKSIL